MSRDQSICRVDLVRRECDRPAMGTCPLSEGLTPEVADEVARAVSRAVHYVLSHEGSMDYAIQLTQETPVSSSTEDEEEREREPD